MKSSYTEKYDKACDCFQNFILSIAGIKAELDRLSNKILEECSKREKLMAELRKTKKEFDKLCFLLKEHEGFRSKPYKDSTGHLTIGYGRNLEDVGISEEEAEYLLHNDIEKAEESLNYIFDTSKLSENRYMAFLDMMFNLGSRKFLTFRKMIAAVRRGDFIKASEEMLDSKWAKQVGKRATELSEMVRRG